MAYSFPTESADIDAMLGDSPHSITASAVIHPCFYELRGEAGDMEGSAAPQINQVEVATVKAAHFPAIKQGDAVRIAEAGAWQQDFTVLQVLAAGAMIELLLQRV